MSYYIIGKEGGSKDKITKEEVREYVSRIYGGYKAKTMLKDLNTGRIKKIVLQFTIIIIKNKGTEITFKTF